MRYTVSPWEGYRRPRLRYPHPYPERGHGDRSHRVGQSPCGPLRLAGPGREPHARLLIDTNIAKGYAIGIPLVGLGILDQTRGATQERAVYTLFPEVWGFNNMGIRGDECVSRHDERPPARNHAPFRACRLAGMGTLLLPCLTRLPPSGVHSRGSNVAMETAYSHM